MMGKNHISMAAATMVLATDSYFLMQHESLPLICHEVAEAVKSFLFNSGWIPMWMFLPCCMVLFVIGNLVPDMDNPNSLLGRIIYIPVKHRTWLHAVYLPAVVLILGIFTRMLFWFGAGIFFHLVYDCPSTWGVNWFYPKRSKRHLVLYETDTPSERIFCCIIWGITVLLSGLAVYLRVYQRAPVL